MQNPTVVLILFLPLIIGSCLVIPKTEHSSVSNCELITKRWTLEFHRIDSNNECYGCDDFVRGVIECGGEVEECVAILATVSIGWTVIAGSVVVVGNTVHWLEKQGSCEDSLVKSSINKLYSSTLDLGGLVINSSSDFVNYLTKKKMKKENNK